MSITLPIPHILQTSQADCLAACAAMVLTHLNKLLPYNELLSILNIQWFGAPFGNIRNLEQIGVRILYKQGSLFDLNDHLTVGEPIITPIFTGELPYAKEMTNHTVVIVGIREHYVYINDPAVTQAPIPVPKGDFDLAWLERDKWYAVIKI